VVPKSGELKCRGHLSGVAFQIDEGLQTRRVAQRDLVHVKDHISLAEPAPHLYQQVTDVGRVENPLRPDQ